MKKKITSILTVVLLLIVSSCNNDFLEENKKLVDGYNLDAPLFVQPVSAYTEVSVTLPDLKNKDFKVLQYPKIIHFETFDGHIDESGKLSFRIKVDAFDNPVQLKPQNLGSIILNVAEFGFLSIEVQSVNLGTPKASVTETFFDFGTTRNEKDFTIENWADGFLWYKLIKKPSWVNLKRTSMLENYLEVDDVKMIQPNSYTPYSIFPDTEGLTPGEYEGEIIFETSDEANPLLKIAVKIKVLLYENPETMIPLEGTVMDAEFDKNTNTIYITTQNPNKLISYNIETNLKNEVILDRNANCVTLSDDNKQIFVGQSAKLTHIDAATLSIVKSYDLSFNVKDVVYDGSDYCYMSHKGSGFDYLDFITRLNMKTSLTNTYDISYVDDNTNLFKVKNTSYFFAARESTSPSGVILFDTSTNGPKIIKYWHDDEGVRFWFSEDQKYMYTQYGRIYLRPTEQTQDKLSSLGLLIPYEYDITYSLYRYNWIDHCANSKSIWTTYNRWNPTVTKNIVTEFDDVTYTRKRVLPLNDYQVIINGINNFYPTNAHYVFANRDGDKLTLIKNVDYVYNTNSWHLEIIDVSK